MVASAHTSAYLLLGLSLASYLGTCVGIPINIEKATTNDNTTYPQITIAQGTLQGVDMVTRKNRSIYGFIGVPFAQPPIGDLRFEAPEPPEPWNGTLDAGNVNETIKCPQFDEGDGSFIGDEDCLYLNVYTPQLPTVDNSTSLLPVMVYIIGGAFYKSINSALRFGPDFMLDEDVILLIPNFRLGVLGFLSTGDEVAPGNYGLKDIVQALKWTQENIEHFGGDPNQVTLFGGSSGGMSVHVLALSDSTNGLIHKIMTQSGSALYPNFGLPKDVYAKRATQLGEYLGCPTNTSTLLVNCLKGITNVSQIIDTKSIFYEWQMRPDVIWLPTYEPDIDGALITDTPANLIAAGKTPDLPWLSMITWDDGLTTTIAFADDPDLFEDFLSNLDTALPIVLNYKDSVDNETKYTEALKSYYLNDLSADRSLLLENLTQLMGDAPFIYPSYKSLQLQLPVAESPLYFSAFKYRGNFSKTYTVSGGSTEYVGATHGDEIIYLFPHHDSQFAPDGYEFTDADWKMVDTMVQLWTSFAISGTPTTAESSVIWEPYSTLNNYLLIGNGTDPALEMQTDLFIERMQFWEELTAGTKSGGIRIMSQVFTMAATLHLLLSI